MDKRIDYASLYKSGQETVVNEATTLKAGLTGIVSLWIYITEQTAVLWFIAILVALFDYLSGVISAWINGEFDSKFGWHGAIRKLGILMLPLFAILMDYVSIILGELINVKFANHGILFIITCVWIIGNDGGSFLANLARAGVPIPAFLVDRMADFQRKELRGEALKNLHEVKQKEEKEK